MSGGAGIFGPIPSETEWLEIGLSEIFRRRWAAFIGDAAARTASDDHRIWRFVAAAGVFDRTPVAGVWSASTDPSGRKAALVLAAPGAVPAATDPWFDAAAEILKGASESFTSAGRLRRQIAALPPIPAAATDVAPDLAAHFWIDDWEMHELRYPTLHALAETGVHDMTAPRLESAED